MRKHLLYLAALLLSCNIAMADNWMTSLPDNVYITQLSIPGTHDAGTGNGFSSLAALFGPTTAQTQDVTISSQWDSGIRAFDFRPAVSNGTLQIYHGIMQTKLTFSNALSIITKKLDENPGEFAVVIMRHEDDADKGDAAWSEMMSTLLKSEFSKYLVNYSPILTLGKVRGKILLISRDKYADKPMGAFASGWSHSDNVEDMKCGTLTGPSRTGKFYVQDYYDMTEAGAIDIKKNSIKALLDCSTHINETTTENIWIINHTSGYTQEASSNGYRNNAVSTNKCVIDYLATTTSPGPTGIILMDYAGVNKSGSYEVRGLELTEAIIANNKRYEMRGTGTSGIDDIEADNIVISPQGTVVGKGTIKLYSTSGQLLASAENEMTLPESGLFIVKTAGTAKKVMR